MTRQTVLLADDNRLLVEQVAKLLDPWFSVVGTAHDGQELVDQALQLAPDVLVVDIGMPVLTGVEAVHRLRKLGVRARVVFLTIHNESEFLDACFAEDAIGYVLKTQMIGDLVPAIQAAMEGRQFVSSGMAVTKAPSMHNERA